MTQKYEKFRKFDEARKLYPGTKRGCKTECDNFCRKHKDWRVVLPLLKPAIQEQIAWRQGANGDFRPPWKNFRTWINRRCWEDELSLADSEVHKDQGSKKQKLLPLVGKICSEEDCIMPAVYKNMPGYYDRYYCSEHLPDKVKELYR